MFHVLLAATSTPAQEDHTLSAAVLVIPAQTVRLEIVWHAIRIYAHFCTGCQAGSLAPSSFDPSQYSILIDQECDAGLYYKCNFTTPTFLGCCQDNPCAAGSCSDLAGAFLSNNPTDAAQFLSLNSTWVATATASQSSTVSTSSPTSSSAVSSFITSTTSSSEASASTATTDTLPGPATKSSTNLGPIIGGAVAGFCLLVVLMLGILWMRRRKSRDGADPPASHGPVYTAPVEQMQHPYTDHRKPSKEYPPSTCADYPSDDYKSPNSAVKFSPDLSAPSPSPRSPPPPSYNNYAERNSHAPSELGLTDRTSHAPSELEGVGRWELDGGQRYHAYVPPRG